MPYVRHRSTTMFSSISGSNNIRDGRVIHSTPMEAEALLLGNFMLDIEVVVLCIPGCDCNVCILAAGRGDACAILKGKHCVASCFKKLLAPRNLYHFCQNLAYSTVSYHCCHQLTPLCSCVERENLRLAVSVDEIT